MEQLRLFEEAVVDPLDDQRPLIFDRAVHRNSRHAQSGAIRAGAVEGPIWHQLDPARIKLPEGTMIGRLDQQRFVQLLNTAGSRAVQQKHQRASLFLQQIHLAYEYGLILTPLIHAAGVSADYQHINVLDWSERGGFRVRPFSPGTWLRYLMRDAPHGIHMSRLHALDLTPAKQNWLQNFRTLFWIVEHDTAVWNAIPAVMGEALAQERSDMQVHTLRGKDIWHAYNSGISSCMSDQYIGRLSLYVENPEVVALLVARKGDTTVARRLLWTLNDGSLLADRLYSSSEAARQLLRQAANQIGAHNAAEDSNGYWSLPNGGRGIWVNAKWPSSGSFPYLDRFPYVGPDPFDRTRIRLYPGSRGDGYWNLLYAQYTNGALADSSGEHCLNSSGMAYDERGAMPEPPWYHASDDVLTPNGWGDWTDTICEWADYMSNDD